MVQSLKGWYFAKTLGMVSTIWNPDFFVQISNGWAFGFQIPFNIQTICKPTSFCKTQGSRFQIPLYLETLAYNSLKNFGPSENFFGSVTGTSPGGWEMLV